MPQQRNGGSDGNGDEREAALEHALVARSQKGDRAAFNELVERHQAAAYALALRMLGDPDTAADVTQDAFFSAFRAIDRFRGSSFRAWLFRIVSNGCYDTFRAHARRPATSLDAALEGERDATGMGAALDSHLPQALIDPSFDPERAALRSDTVAQIQAALLQLPAEQRLALILSDVQGLAYDEIAGIMGSSLGTVKSRIFRARAHMRALLTREGELFGPARRPDGGHGRE